MHDDLDARRETLDELAKGESAPRRQRLGQRGDGLGDGDGVDGDVVQTNNGYRLLFDAVEVRERQLSRRHAREQVRWLNLESVVDAPETGVGPSGAFEERDESVGEGGVSTEFQQSREQDVALFPPNELFVQFSAVSPRQETLTLHLEQYGGDQEELREFVHREFGRFIAQDSHERVDERGERHVEDVDVVRGDQLKQQFYGAAKGRRRHDESHSLTLLRDLATPLTYDCAMRILSGIQPSGLMHVGNYLGAIRQWVDAQSSDAYYCVVDLHALTLQISPEALREQTTDALATLIASGLDPEVCTIFIQSQVPYHAQLNWLLECVTTYGELSRMTAFKEKSQRQEGYRVGLLTYPVLMAGDILLYDTLEVPVGDDQRQHLELARTIAERFNNRFGETFHVPVGTQPKVAARVMDLQEPTRKMSKSVSSPLGNLLMFDSPDDIKKKISKAVTDTDGEVRFDWEKKPGLSNLLEVYSSFSGETPEEVASRYTRYGELKTDLTELIVARFAPMKERYDELLRDPADLYKIAAHGAEKAADVAGVVYRRAAVAMGLNV